MSSTMNPKLVSLLVSNGITIVPADSVTIKSELIITKHSDTHTTITNNRAVNVDNKDREIKTRRYMSFMEIKDYIVSTGHKNIVIVHLDSYTCRSAKLANMFQNTSVRTITYTSW